MADEESEEKEAKKAEVVEEEGNYSNDEFED